MSRTRMEWDWVGDYPIFVFMNYASRGRWRVRVVKGTKGKQNDPNIGPWSPSWKKYETINCISRHDVCVDACRKAKKWLKIEN